MHATDTTSAVPISSRRHHSLCTHGFLLPMPTRVLSWRSRQAKRCTLMSSFQIITLRWNDTKTASALALRNPQWDWTPVAHSNNLLIIHPVLLSFSSLSQPLAPHLALPGISAWGSLLRHPTETLHLPCRLRVGGVRYWARG